jgi:LmbE family N-acetylglucosaminyl deacetylase
MIMAPIRNFLCRFYRRFVFSKNGQLDENQLKYSAIVFAPHQDDETLGCGGAIIQKKRAGADVKIVFMTDGSTSHNHLISKDELKLMRVKEALAACQVLGLAESDVVFLEFEDGRLGEHRAQVICKVAEILRRQEPDEVFLPYYRDLTPDHLATNEIVISALRSWQKKVTVYEYPVWAWHHWPWVSLPIGRGRGTKTILINSFKAWFGLRLLRDFQSFIQISDVKAQKRMALNQHRSQMNRLFSNPNWTTLHDVSNGEFLDCFFQEREIFRRYQLN